MIQPELQVDPTVWNEIKPFDYVNNSEPIQKYPDLLQYLKTNPWRTMSGHSCTKSYMDKFKKEIDTKSEDVRCTIQLNRNFVKLILLTPVEYSAIQLADCLLVKVPFIKDKIKHTVSVEKKEIPKPAKPMEILKNYSGYDGSLCGNLSDDDILTEFEIEETHEMAAEWIKNGWYVPPPRPQQQTTPTSKQDRPIEQLNRKIKKVTFQDDQPTKSSTTKTKPKNRCPSLQSTKGTQTKTWKELIQIELDSDHFHDCLFNTTDTEHDSEETLVSN